jgi:SulP family sulfate permease
MPADFFGMLATLGATLHTFNPVALGIAAASLAIIVLWQFFMPKLGSVQFAGKLTPIPGSIVALVLATLAVWLLNLPVDTIGSRFGGIPAGLPAFAWPAFSWESAKFLLIPTLTLAMLGAIESLLCARVADGMIGERHDPNQELMAQGIANFVTPFFGGMPATGTIARTVTNIKSGASSPIAGMVHAATLLVVILVAAPLASHVPLAALAAILMFVAWNMGEWREFVNLRQYRTPYRVTLLAVFFLTVVFDLTVAVEAGLIAACITFIYRISSLSRSEPITAADQPVLAGHEGRIEVHRLYGALFFGAVKLIEVLEDHLPEQALVIDLKNVIYVDSSGADSLLNLERTCRKQGVRLIVCGLVHQPLDMARRCGFIDAIAPQNQCVDLAAGLAAALDPPAG